MTDVTERCDFPEIIKKQNQTKKKERNDEEKEQEEKKKKKEEEANELACILSVKFDFSSITTVVILRVHRTFLHR